jgi:hypothetical protein
MRRALQLLLVGLAPALVSIPAHAQVADTKPPVIHHTPITSATNGDTVSITAQIIDESEVFGATLWYRTVGSSTYTSVELTRKGDLWGAAIPINQDTQYWLEAYDEFGNGPTRAGTPEKPFVIHAAAPAPLYAPRAPAPKPVPAPVAPEPADEPGASSAPVRTTPAASPPPPPPPLPAEPTPPPPAARSAGAGLSATPAPVVEPPRSESSDDDLGEADHFQIKSAQPPPGTSAFAPPVEKGPPPGPAYQQWWFITGVTVVGAAAIATAVYFLLPRPVYRNVFNANVQP